MSRFTSGRRKAGLVAALGVLAVLAAACGSSSNGSSSGSGNHVVGTREKGGTVTMAERPNVTPNWIFPVASLAYFSTYNISWLQQPMYRPLYWFGGNNLQPTLDEGLSVANAPQYSADGKSITISLKPWKWSNGESVTADDVVFWMHMVKAEKDNWAGTAPGAYPDNVTNTTKVNDTTVKLTLNAKYSDNWFTYNELSQITPMPMAWDVTSMGAKPGSGGCTADQSKCPAVYNFLAGLSKDQASYATSPVWGVVDGPWRLGSYSSSGHYSLVPNKSYSGSPKPSLSEVKFLPFTSDSAEYNVLKSGNGLDIGYIPTQDLAAKSGSSDVPKANPVGSTYMEPQFLWSVNYMPINFNNPTVGAIFKQLYVRQALQETLDQPVVVTKAFKGYADPNFSPVPVKPANKWVSPAAKAGMPYPFDPSKAKSRLTSHGWTEQNGVMTCTSPGTGSNQCGAGVKSGQRLEFNVHYASGVAALDQQMQQYKTDASKAGIDLILRQMPFNSVIGESVPCTPNQKACNWQFDTWGGGWIYAPDYLPTGEALFGTGSGSNSGNYSDAQMDKLIAASQHQDGTAPFFAFEDYAAQQVPVVYQPNPYRIWAINSHVGGVKYNPLGTMLPEYWYRTK